MYRPRYVKWSGRCDVMGERKGAREVSQPDAAAYGAARDILVELLGFAAGQIDAEQARPEPDDARLASWRRRRDEWAARLGDLRPHDALAVRGVLDEDAAVLRSLHID
jgi:hypothetical protein